MELASWNQKLWIFNCKGWKIIISHAKIKPLAYQGIFMHWKTNHLRVNGSILSAKLWRVWNHVTSAVQSCLRESVNPFSSQLTQSFHRSVETMGKGKIFLYGWVPRFSAEMRTVLLAGYVGERSVFSCSYQWSMTQWTAGANDSASG